MEVSTVGLHAGRVTIMQHMANEDQHLPKHLIDCQTFLHIRNITVSRSTGISQSVWYHNMA
jgi:hypothetical protein